MPLAFEIRRMIIACMWLMGSSIGSQRHLQLILDVRVVHKFPTNIWEMSGELGLVDKGMVLEYQRRNKSMFGAGAVQSVPRHDCAYKWTTGISRGYTHSHAAVPGINLITGVR
ncbi:hypothetical protein OG21DRAFT_1103032 [Imleria badia]|nr:hypothetical protein OG21DRAFT_1103032 [Imleria badia]